MIFVYATDRTSRFPAIESMQRTIFESSGAEREGRGPRPGAGQGGRRPAETAAVSGDDGEYDAWTFTSGKTRFIVVTHQMPDAGAFDLSKRVPDLLTAGSCTDT